MIIHIPSLDLAREARLFLPESFFVFLLFSFLFPDCSQIAIQLEYILLLANLPSFPLPTFTRSLLSLVIIQLH